MTKTKPVHRTPADLIDAAAELICDASPNGQRWANLGEVFRDIYRTRARVLHGARLLVDPTIGGEFHQQIHRIDHLERELRHARAEAGSEPRQWTDGAPEPDGVRVVRDRVGDVLTRRATGSWHSAVANGYGNGGSWKSSLRSGPLTEVTSPELVAALLEVEELKRRIACAREEVRAERSPVKPDGDALFITQESRENRLVRIVAALDGRIPDA